MIQVLAILAVVTALTGLWGGWERQGKLTAQAQVAERDAKIEQQNAAIKATAEDGQRRVAAAALGVQTARKATQALAADRDRLLAAAFKPDGTATPTPPGACPEKAAAAIVRAGLRP